MAVNGILVKSSNRDIRYDLKKTTAISTKEGGGIHGPGAAHVGALVANVDRAASKNLDENNLVPGKYMKMMAIIKMKREQTR